MKIDMKNRKLLGALRNTNPTLGVGVVLLIAGALIGIAGYRSQNPNAFNLAKLISDFYANVSTELISITITVLIIDTLNRRREEHELKKQLVREMGGRDNGIATRAATEIEVHGWLKDGSLRGVDLREANLEQAELGGADMEGIKLDGANLKGAKLSHANLVNAGLEYATLEGAYLLGAHLYGATLLWANLEGATLGDAIHGACLCHANLEGADVSLDDLALATELTGATMPDGKRYSGLLNIRLDVLTASEEGFDTNDPDSMAKFYEVPVEEYIAGQEWARSRANGISTQSQG